jgi:hypothetical protein
MFFEELWEKVEGDLAAIRLDHDEEIGDVVIAALMGDSRLVLDTISGHPEVLTTDETRNPLPYAISSGRWDLVGSILRLPLPISADILRASASRVVQVQHVHPLTAPYVTELLNIIFGKLNTVDPGGVYHAAANTYFHALGDPTGQFPDQILPFFFGLDQRLFLAPNDTWNEFPEVLLDYQRKFAEMQVREQAWGNVQSGVRRNRSPSGSPMSSPPRTYRRM